MQLEVTVPDESMGDVIGDLNCRRGRVLGVDPKPPQQVIRAEVPMAEVLKYAPDLRSMTSGRGDFHMSFAHYEEVPPHLAEARHQGSSRAARSRGGERVAVMRRRRSRRSRRPSPPVPMRSPSRRRWSTTRTRRGGRQEPLATPPGDDGRRAIKLALRGNREVRMILIRDSNRLIRRFVLQNPRVGDEEIIAICKNRSADDELLRIIADSREWTKNYQVRLSLVTNPKTPLALSLRFLASLQDRDVRMLAKSKNVSATVANAAKRIVTQNRAARAGPDGRAPAASAPVVEREHVGTTVAGDVRPVHRHALDDRAKAARRERRMARRRARDSRRRRGSGPRARAANASHAATRRVKRRSASGPQATAPNFT